MEPASVDYSLDDNGRFIIENYNWAKPFSNFFPGIAGKWGIPLWAYYVNRAQCISSMGIKDKDHAILEFQSFNKACQSIGQQGFRTFIKLEGKGIYEPFKKTRNENIIQRILISSHELEITEDNHEEALSISVRYFPLVNLPLAGLVRQVEIANLANRPRKIELLDGVSRVLPYGVNYDHVKNIPRHIEGMMGVVEVSGVPYYKLKQTAADIEEIGVLEGGNFYISLLNGKTTPEESKIVDPKIIFGDIENLDFPWSFDSQTIEEIISQFQVKENRTPCAFTAVSLSLSRDKSLRLDSVLGFADRRDQVQKLLDVVKDPKTLKNKREENLNIIEEIKQAALTISEEPAFDQYSQQTYLDNVMRGGNPIIIQGNQSEAVFYTYIRQGGDLERDYHWFVLEPTYLSQGNGHYRNVLQNRRLDNWFYPGIGDHNIITFMNFIQLDGYNPLVVNGITYTASDLEKIRDLLSQSIGDETKVSSLVEYVEKPFTPGEFVMKAERIAGGKPQDYEEILADLLPHCKAGEIGSLHAGFWIDHWFYNLDLIESYLAIFPDKVFELLFGTLNYTYFDNPDIVQPRAQKTKFTNNGVRQFGAVFRDNEKEKLIHSRETDPYKVRTKKGYGEVYRTNLFGKLVCLLTNKIASLDRSGIGIEMEASKPGWCDSLNGLPGLFGSSLCESLELIRMCRLLLQYLNGKNTQKPNNILLFDELYSFILGLNEALRTASISELPNRSLFFWEQSHDLKEEYREKVRLGITGEEVNVEFGYLIRFIENCLELVETNITDSPEKIESKDSIPYTYFINEIVEYDRVQSDADHQISPIRIQVKPVSLFLEGPVHYIRVFPERAASIYQNVRSSGLYDQKLETFKSSDTLENEPYEIGRIKAYPSGWIEHEAIYTHMQYKWLLEILRAGLFDEFIHEIKSAFPPFLDPKIYGRSTLENCSFIAGSANPDESIHGRAFQPRYSGVTSEMLNIWFLMVVGQQPFVLTKNKELCFQLKPTLPDWLFTKGRKVVRHNSGEGQWQELEVQANSFAFKLFGKTFVQYHNPKRKPTFGENGSEIQSYRFEYPDGRHTTVENDVVKNQLAQEVRDGKITKIEVLFI